MTGGTEIIISPEGITVKTAGYAKFFASEHVLEGGASQSFQLPILPNVDSIEKKSMRFDLSHLSFLSDFESSKYRIYKDNHSYYEGVLDERGRTSRVHSYETENLEIFVEDPDFIAEEEFFIDSEADSQEG